MRLFYIPCPSQDVARMIADTLLSEKLIACANILAPMESRYVWEGEVAQETEIPLLLKTSPDLRARLETRIAELHPYDVPAILSCELDANPAFVTWIGEIL